MSRKREMSPRLNRTGWCFVIPSVILIILFVFYPMVQALITSFQTGAGNNLTFTGIANYKRLLTDTTFRKGAFQYDTLPDHSGADHDPAGARHLIYAEQ